jgi:hypothetical protein
MGFFWQEEDLRTAFQPFGVIQNIKVIREKGGEQGAAPNSSNTSGQLPGYWNRAAGADSRGWLSRGQRAGHMQRQPHAAPDGPLHMTGIRQMHLQFTWQRALRNGQLCAALCRKDRLVIQPPRRASCLSAGAPIPQPGQRHGFMVHPCS